MIAEVNSRILDITAEIRCLPNGYVQFPFVISVLLDRYGINDWNHLNIGSIDSIPASRLIHALNRKINIFLSCTLSSKAIISIVNLDRELTVHLNSFNLPSLYTLQLQPPQSSSCIIDPNEIDIEGNDTVDIPSIPVPSKFIEFGLGHLVNHPLVVSYFPYLQHSSSASSVSLLPSSIINSPTCHYISEQDVLTALYHYLTTATFTTTTATYTDFITYLLSSTSSSSTSSSSSFSSSSTTTPPLPSPYHVSQLGIYISPALFPAATGSDLPHPLQPHPQHRHIPSHSTILTTMQSILHQEQQTLAYWIHQQQQQQYQAQSGQTKGGQQATFDAAAATSLDNSSKQQQSKKHQQYEQQRQKQSLSSWRLKRPSSQHHPLLSNLLTTIEDQLLQGNTSSNQPNQKKKRNGKMNQQDMIGSSNSSSNSSSSLFAPSLQRIRQSLQTLLQQHDKQIEKLQRKLANNNRSKQKQQEQQHYQLPQDTRMSRKRRRKGGEKRCQDEQQQQQQLKAAMDNSNDHEEEQTECVEEEEQQPQLIESPWQQEEEADDQELEQLLQAQQALQKELIEAASEYLFLHLGKVSNRNKRYKAIDASEDETTIKTTAVAEVEASEEADEEAEESAVAQTNVGIKKKSKITEGEEDQADADEDGDGNDNNQEKVTELMDNTEGKEKDNEEDRTVTAVDIPKEITDDYNQENQADIVQRAGTKSPPIEVAAIGDRTTSVNNGIMTVTIPRTQPVISSYFEASFHFATTAANAASIAEYLEVVSAENNSYLQSLGGEIYQTVMPSNTIGSKTAARSAFQEVGRRGECLVYHYLQRQLHTATAATTTATATAANKQSAKKLQQQPVGRSPGQVRWLNEHQESTAPYDLVMDYNHPVTGSKRQRFIEVKSSRYDDNNNVFVISLWEYEFAMSLVGTMMEYHIYRVVGLSSQGGVGVGAGAGSGIGSKVKIIILKDIRKLLELGRIKLCLAI